MARETKLILKNAMFCLLHDMPMDRQTSGMSLHSIAICFKQHSRSNYSFVSLSLVDNV